MATTREPIFTPRAPLMIAIIFCAMFGGWLAAKELSMFLHSVTGSHPVVAAEIAKTQ